MSNIPLVRLDNVFCMPRAMASMTDENAATIPAVENPSVPTSKRANAT